MVQLGSPYGTGTHNDDSTTSHRRLAGLGDCVTSRQTSVVLRDLRDDDLETLEHWLQPDQEWHLWDAPYYDKLDAYAVSAYIDTLRQRLCVVPDLRDSFVIADRNDDRLLGTLSWHWEHQPAGWARTGITLYDPRVRGQGVGTQALSLVTSYIFNNTDAHRVDYLTWSGNTAMCRVGEKLGWTKEASFREAREVRGRRYDSVGYGILRSEWLSRHSTTA